MTVSNIITALNYIVSGGNDTYAIPFDFVLEDTVKVYVDSVLQEEGALNDYTFINYVTDDRDNYLPTSIKFVAASQPSNGAIVTISRESSIIQEEDFMDGDPVPQVKFEEGLDKLTLVVQEVADRQDRAITLPLGSTPSVVNFPIPGADEFIKWNLAGTALETEAIDLDPINASILALQAIDASLQVQITSNDGDITTLQADVVTNTGNIATFSGELSALETRVLATENAILGIDAAFIIANARLHALELVNGLRSSQVIANNAVAPVILGDFTVDGDQFDYLLVDYIINRKTDSNYLSEAGTLHLVMRPNYVWTFENGLQVVDIAGVTFAIATLAGNIGQLSYTSTNVAGTSYVGKMRYTIKKYEV